MRRAAGLLAATVVAGGLAAGGARAQGCRLALSLALDVSSSVDAEEYALQVRGLAAALTAPDVRAAFLSHPGQPVALHIFEWSGRRQHDVRQDWVLIASGADLDRVAAGLQARGRSHSEFPTALGYALAFAARELRTAPPCHARTIDISGDGTNNDGFSPLLARREFPLEDVTINGLVIGESRETLRRYYRQFVIQGSGAFVEVAEDYDDFERAMRRKLLRELGTGAVSGLAPEGPVARN